MNGITQRTLWILVAVAGLVGAALAVENGIDVKVDRKIGSKYDSILRELDNAKDERKEIRADVRFIREKLAR